jgi:hypothetical protein
MNGLRAALCMGLALLALAAAGGCTRPCKEGTVFLRILYLGGLEADNIQITLSQEETSLVSVRRFVPRRAEDSIEIRFPGAYPQGATLTFEVVAEQSGQPVSVERGQVRLAAGCTAVEVAVRPGGGVQIPDLAAPDLGTPDLATSLALSHLPQHYLSDGTCDFSIDSATHVFDTDQGTLDSLPLPSACVFGTESQTGRNGSFLVGVLAVRSLTIRTGATLRITGSRTLAIVAGGSIQIDGTLDGSANLDVPGPGGLSVGIGWGGQGTIAANGADSGGGGGGYGSSGARAADASSGGAIANGGEGGGTYNNATLTQSVEAGSAGGAGSTSIATSPCGLGGGGGGAIQLSAGGSLQMGSSGKVLANGGGGLGGCLDNGAYGGGGGGSGGALFLESPTLTIMNTAVLAANGGGGGAGADGTVGQRGNDGDNGKPSTSVASGGAGVGSGASGGNGAADNTVARTGPIDTNGGGGGGGVGRIVLRAESISTTGSVISPPPNMQIL